MLKIEHFGSTFLKINVRFEISTFEVGYKGNFVKIRELIFSDPKCPNLGIWTQNLESDLKSAPSKEGTR